MSDKVKLRTFDLSKKTKILVILFIIVLSATGTYFIFKSRAAENLILYSSDEFNGSSLDNSKWKPKHSDYGYGGGGQLQCHTPNNISVSVGTLKITSKKESYNCPVGGAKTYTSGFLDSGDQGVYYPLYGKYELRARVPHGQGVGAAFWLTSSAGGASDAEVDVFEVFHSQVPGSVTQTLHFPNSLGSGVTKQNTKMETAVKGTGGWHTYAVNISQVNPGSDAQIRFQFFIDDVLTKEYVNTNPSQWVNKFNDKNKAWIIKISMPVGGRFWGHPELSLGYLASGLQAGLNNPNVCSLTYKAPLNNNPANCSDDKNGDGVPDIWFAQFPATYEVDYFRVYTAGQTNPPPPVNDTTPPTAPTNATVAPISLAQPSSSDPIRVSWTASTDNVGVDRYLITRDGGYEIGYSTSTSFNDTTADKSICVDYCHTYIIYALDAAANKSSASNKAIGMVSNSLPAIVGDINKDNKVNIQDLSMLLSRWGTADSQADINKNGTVNIQDLSILLSNWTG